MLLHSRTLAWMLLLCALPLAGCGAPQIPATRVERVAPPEGLLSCRPEPEIPLQVSSDADLAVLLIDLAEAGADCRSKLDQVRSFVSGAR